MAIPRFQFGILRLVILTAACAGVCALTRLIDAPLLFQITITIYFLILVIYGVLRLPYLFGRIKAQRRKLREIRQRRSQLENAISEKVRAEETDQ